jgi:iron complex outermembrane receptor protein
MSHRKTLLAASIIASLCLSGAVFAQDSTQDTNTAVAKTKAQVDAEKANAAQAQTLETVTVTGIRASLQASLDTKRNADAIVDAITAEDIGKFPATNVAEALAQIPGVTLDRSIPATQRVSINGIDPSLNLTLLDGHPVAQAMWLFGDSPNRGFNYSLLPPEILGSLEIYKSPEARLPEGAIGGTVIMHTIKPLDVASGTLTGSFGDNYNKMADINRPSGSVFYSWKNDASTFGVDASAQHFEQFTGREGLENYGYTSVGSLNTAALAAGNNNIQNLINSGAIKPGDQMPNQMSAANFQQTEKRDDVTVNIQWKPSDQFETSLGLMYMKDNLDNVNQSTYAWQALRPGGITSLTEGPNGIIVAGSSRDPNPPCVGDTAGACGNKAITFSDNFARGSHITTKGVDWQAKYSGDGWRLDGQIGVSTSRNPMTSALKEIAYGGSFDWTINKGFNFTDPATANNPAYWADYGWGGNYSTLLYKAKDQYAQLNFTKDLDGFVNQLEVGARYAIHWESQDETVFTGATPLTLTQIGFGGLTNLSGNSSLGLAPSSVQHVQTAGFQAIMDAVRNSPGFGQAADAVSTWDNTFNVKQTNTAAYLQANFGNDNLHGNVGVRWVRTENASYGFNVPGTCLASDSWACPFPAGFGYVGQSSTRYDWLPSFNIAYNVTPDFIVRAAGSETIAYAPYNQMAPYFEANDTVLTATAGNPNLKPYRSINGDLSAEWYFTPSSVVAASVFYKNVLNYIVQQATLQDRINGSWTLPGYLNSTGNAQIAAGLCTAQGICQYDVTAPVDGGRAKVKGFTLSYQQAFGNSGFGARANYTYSDASTQSGGALPYNSKNAYNLGPYFEMGPYSASVSYSWRSSYLAGGYVAGAPATFVDGWKELDASVGYALNKNISFSLDALNLLNSTYYTYLGSKTQISSEYVTGRQYMLTAHFKL